jgi:hypothetical protein
VHWQLHLCPKGLQRGVEVKINAFLTSSLDDGESVSCSGHFMPTKRIFNIKLLGREVSLRDIMVKAEVTAPIRN